MPQRTIQYTQSTFEALQLIIVLICTTPGNVTVTYFVQCISRNIWKPAKTGITLGSNVNRGGTGPLAPPLATLSCGLSRNILRFHYRPPSAQNISIRRWSGYCHYYMVSSSIIRCSPGTARCETERVQNNTITSSKSLCNGCRHKERTDTTS